jgi:hypothetical protein
MIKVPGGGADGSPPTSMRTAVTREIRAPCSRRRFTADAALFCLGDSIQTASPPASYNEAALDGI